MKVIGTIGLIGSGKDTVAQYIARRYGYTIISMRDLVKEVTEKEGLEPTRENLQTISEKYRKTYGMDYFARLATEKASGIGAKKVLISEMRKPEDITVPKARFGKDIMIILIEADPEIRFERLRKRGRLGDPKTFEQFQRQEKREYELYFSKSLHLAEYRIENNGTLEELYNKIDSLLKEHGFD
jgi:dephospho-CoA kinase